jgi:uncharacterized protein (DUF362 family)
MKPEDLETVDCLLFRASYDQVGQLTERIAALLPEGGYRRILIKPNWVIHEQSESFPIKALVTHPSIIDATVAACLAKYPDAERITVGDVPLQSCNWELLKTQAGIDALIAKYADVEGPQVRFLDLRKERWRADGGFLAKAAADGDPLGYREVVLDSSSFLEPVSRAASRFRVSDFDPDAIQSSHRPGYHRYLISGSVLDSDLFINLPKMKTHQKTGVTGALKNLVGINGAKEFLAHHREGFRSRDADEFPPDVSPLFVLQARVRAALQKRSQLLFRFGRFGWSALKKVYRVETHGVPKRPGARAFISSGSWYGNDTVWRMVYDLNKIVLYAPPEGGALAASRQRSHLMILDAVVAGEGNGPLQPEPVELGLVGLSLDPFATDLVMARLMGFDYRKIPLLRGYAMFEDSLWGRTPPERMRVDHCGALYESLSEIPPAHRFIPPPGWRGHVEDESRPEST